MHYFFEKPRARKPLAGASLRRILVRCPATSKLAPTGQTVEEEVWPKTKLDPTRLTCPHCKQVHRLAKKDVVLAR